MLPKLTLVSNRLHQDTRQRIKDRVPDASDNIIVIDAGFGFKWFAVTKQTGDCVDITDIVMGGEND